MFQTPSELSRLAVECHPIFHDEPRRLQQQLKSPNGSMGASLWFKLPVSLFALLCTITSLTVSGFARKIKEEEDPRFGPHASDFRGDAALRYDSGAAGILGIRGSSLIFDFWGMERYTIYASYMPASVVFSKRVSFNTLADGDSHNTACRGSRCAISQPGSMHAPSRLLQPSVSTNLRPRNTWSNQPPCLDFTSALSISILPS